MKKNLVFSIFVFPKGEDTLCTEIIPISGQGLFSLTGIRKVIPDVDDFFSQYIEMLLTKEQLAYFSRRISKLQFVSTEKFDYFLELNQILVPKKSPKGWMLSGYIKTEGIMVMHVWLSGYGPNFINLLFDQLKKDPDLGDAFKIRVTKSIQKIFEEELGLYTIPKKIDYYLNKVDSRSN